MSPDQPDKKDPSLVKKVSKKKILFVDLDEEITQLFERIEPLPYKEIYLVVPKRAVLLQSVVNLRILKQKLADLGKELCIVTSDLNGMKLAHQAEIKVYDEFSLQEKDMDQQEFQEEKALLKPIAATSNEVQDELPSRLPKKKSSIFEVVKETRKDAKGFSLRRFFLEKKRLKNEKESLRMVLSASTRRFLAGILVLSMMLFFFIAYVVLPGATIWIEPSSDVITRGLNVTLTRTGNGEKELKAYPVDTEVEVTLTHAASGIVSEGNRARGNITIYNELANEQPLVGQTRFQTEDGLVFRIQKDVVVPAASAQDKPGQIVAEVVADEVDANQSPIGKRGNIEPTQFFLPGLQGDNREKVYAKSTTAFTGGETSVKTLVLEEDLKAAQIQLENELKEKALAALKREVSLQGSQRNMDLRLLEDSDALIYGSAQIELPLTLIGQEHSDFEISGSLSISGVCFDQESLLESLKKEVLAAKSPGKQVVKVNDESVSIKLLELDPANSVYKFTAEIQAIEEYEIDPDLEGGGELAKKIREHISGKSKDEAERYLQNLPEINRVEIKIWPSWSPNIPKLEENIRIRSLSREKAVE